MNSTGHRQQLNRSAAYLRECRRRYVRLAYDFLTDTSVSPADRNAVIEKMATRMAVARLYSFPRHYDPRVHQSPRNVRHGIGSHLHREWKRRTAITDAQLVAEGKTPPFRRSLWSWSEFCALVGWVPFTGTITNLRIQETA